MTPSCELQLLLGCARADLDAPRREQIQKLLAGPIRWEKLLALASFHALTPLLHSHLQAVCPDALPTEISSRLAERFRDNAARNLWLTHELLQLLARLREGGVLAVPFKGPALAESLYDNIALREFDDLDLLIRRRDFPRAKSILLDLGFRPQSPLSARQEAAYLSAEDEFVFESKDRTFTLDLQWDSARRSFPFGMKSEVWWEHLTQSPLSHTTVPAPRAEFLLALLCLHASRHIWFQIELVSVVAELIRACPDLDWDRVLRATRHPRMILLGALLALNLLEAPLPDEVLHRATADSATRALAAQARARIFRDTLPPPGVMESFRFHLRTQRKAADRLRFAFRFALTPSLNDMRDLRLPDSLFFLHYPLRPFRLLVKNASPR